MRSAAEEPSRRRVLPDAEHIKQAVLDADASLRRIADEHFASCGKDALWVFLRVHPCISEHVLRSQSQSLVWLNCLFVRRCADLYRAFEERDFLNAERVSSLWCNVYEEYSHDPQNYLLLLPMMAGAHILDDLETVLCSVEVTEPEYNSVFDTIVLCLDKTRVEVDGFGDGSLKQGLMDFLVNEFGKTGRDWAIEKLRQFAWDSYQRRLRLALG